MSDYIPSLEDFLEFGDDEVNVDKGGNEVVTDDLQDPMDSHQESTTEEVTTEVAEDTTGDSSEAPETPEEENETSEEGKDVSQASVVYDIMAKSGILQLEEGFEFDGSVDKLAEALDMTKNNLKLEAVSAMWEMLPEDFKTILEYGLSGGTDINAVKDVINKQVNLSKLNIENEDHQKVLVEEYLKKTTQYSEDKIKQRIRKLYDSDLLEEEAVEALKELKTLQEKERADLAQREVDKKKAEQDEIKKAYNVVQQVVKEKLEVSENRKKQIVDAVFTTGKYDGKNETSYIDYVDDLIRNNPEHFAQLVNIYLDYDPAKGFKNIGNSKKAESKAAVTLRDTLQDLLSGSTVVKAVASKTSSGNSDFDFESFIKFGQ